VVEPGANPIVTIDLHPPTDVDLVCEVLNRLVLSERMSAFKRSHAELADALSKHMLFGLDDAITELEEVALGIARNLGLPTGSSTDKRRELQVILARDRVVDVAAALEELGTRGLMGSETVTDNRT